MASEEAAPEPRFHRLFSWFDPESAAVVTILLGLFQVLLSAPLAHIDQSLPKLFILSLFLGILIMAGGSLTMANLRNPPNKLLLQGCVCSNLAGLLGALLAFCLYFYILITHQQGPPCKALPEPNYYYYHHLQDQCPSEKLADYSWVVKLLLVLYDSGAVVMHCLLSVCAFKTLHTE
ncbi:uncharacterized protein si:dkey-9i23.16 [Cololabis saira]|uniref:uncharacterized protein si:dkey-9i23.16 n=1 Tax=Cololabis saira TaxID=129043 RepID=UPI002AD3626A|nr:uncharacterized protein si:dkey-9i23.16 [Cololabis saira]XP_061580355.1 uncharacterized protein si:dkey-9i23.16 [Cololabis saira]